MPWATPKGKQLQNKSLCIFSKAQNIAIKVNDFSLSHVVASNLRLSRKFRAARLDIGQKLIKPVHMELGIPSFGHRQTGPIPGIDEQVSRAQSENAELGRLSSLLHDLEAKKLTIEFLCAYIIRDTKNRR
jgi:hypothetical protein